MKSDNASEFAAIIGVDWADAKHDICLQVAGTEQCQYSELPHTVETIADWAQALQQRFASQPIAIVLELAKGPLVHALQQYPFLALFPVNPAALATYRRTFSPSRAKDDPTDAFLLLDFFKRHRERLSRLNPDSVAMRCLQQMVESRAMLRGDIVRTTNRLASALKNYFPQVLQWFTKKDTRLFCDFMRRWPTPQQASKARKSTLERFFRDHNVRYTRTIEKRVNAIKDLTPLTTDPGVIDPSLLLVESLLSQLEVLIHSRDRYDTEITNTANRIADHRIFESFPGAAAVYAPRLMAAFGEQRQRFPTAAHAQRAFAIAPVIERSGKKTWTHWRYRCNTFVRQSLVEWSALSIPHSFWAKAFYRQQIDKGASRQVALRALAFNRTRILHRCWKDRLPYDENVYLESLRKRQSPLLKYIADNP